MSGHKHTFYVHGIKKVFKVNFPFQTFLADGCSLSVSAGLAGTCWMPLLYLELEQASYWIWKLCQKIQKWGIMKYKICAVAVFFFSLFCVLIFFFISFFHSFGPPCVLHLRVDSVPAVLKVHFELTTKADTGGTLPLIDCWDHWSNFETFEFLLYIHSFFVRSGIKLISLCLMQCFTLQSGETERINK